MIRRRHGKTPYELLHDKPPDLSYLHVFGALCYPTNDSENLGKLQPKADIADRRMASDQEAVKTPLHEMTPVSISSGLVPNPSSSTPFVPPSRSDCDLLFQPMFDESLNVDLHAPKVIAPIPEVVAPEHGCTTGSPSTTTVDQDAPSQTLFIQLCIPITKFLLNTLANGRGSNRHDNMNRLLLTDQFPHYSTSEQALFCYYDSLPTAVKTKNLQSAINPSMLELKLARELHEYIDTSGGSYFATYRSFADADTCWMSRSRRSKSGSIISWSNGYDRIEVATLEVDFLSSILKGSNLVGDEATQLYGAILLVALTNEDIRNSESYKEYYAMASGTIPPKTKGSKKKANTDTITKQKPPTAPTEKKSGKGKLKTST
ncbi:hypothetical protein Tco_1191324 [Tanacetum coccineum]